MANNQPSRTTSIAAAATAPIRDPGPAESVRDNGERRVHGVVGGETTSKAEGVTPQENGSADAPRAGHDASEGSRYKGGGDNGKTLVVATDHCSGPTPAMPSVSEHGPANDDFTTYGTGQSQSPSFTEQSPSNAGQASTMAQSQSYAPLKRFTSVNINKRFLEKTSTSGMSLGASLANHGTGVASTSASAQQRTASPSSRSPSNDRPASSRLVTAKLTAVSQPPASSTSGWLRPSSATPGNSATPTPPSSSPQPQAGESSSVPPVLTFQQSMKRRPGEPPARNGTPASGSTPSIQQQGAKPVWGKAPPPPPKAVLGRAHGKEIQNDFPTAAEAAHGRKTKVLKAQLAAETAAAQTAAQKQAMIETAAAFRGAHLDANARHWDEMEDEDSDFLAGVIEFGDGTQYKIEHKTEVTPCNPSPPSEPTKSPHRESIQSHSPVTKEERFGEDIGRSWPRARTSPVRSIGTSSLPQRPAPLQHIGTHHTLTDGPPNPTHAPHDGTSPTSRVLFNERSNRLEPWSSSRPRSGPPQGPVTMARRDNREEYPPVNPLRQQPSLQVQNRDAPPHSHPSPANFQLLQKGPPDDSVWKGGAPQGFGQISEGGRWVDASGSCGIPVAKDEDRPRELRRRESISSSDVPGSSTRDRSRGRDGRWDTGIALQGREFDQDRDRGRGYSHVGQPPSATLPASLARDRSREAGRQLPPHLLRMPPPPVPSARGAPGRDISSHTSHGRPSVVSPSVSVRSLLSPSSEQAPSISSIPAIVTVGDEGVDKDALVKDAMQLAIERAKKRKQEGEAEEKRRSEAAERARKKAETLAAAQEEKKKAEPLPAGGYQLTMEPSTQESSQFTTKPNGLQQTRAALAGESSDPTTIPPVRTIIPLPTLPRRPSLPSAPTPASQAGSWRNKATPIVSIPPRSSHPLTAQPPARGYLPSTSNFPELDLSVKPDENIEIVDFCDLEKLMGGPASLTEPSAPSPEPAPAPSIRGKRPVASDFFDDHPMESRQPLPLSNSDGSSWRRPLHKHGAPSSPPAPGEELRTQTVPIFSAEDAAVIRETTSSFEPKLPLSPAATLSPLKRHSSQCDQTSSSSTSQSAYMTPAALALRSPRTQSHFKEAPMSTLTDTMSRIKGALDGMQSQDPPVSSNEANEKLPEHQALSIPTASKSQVSEISTTTWRELRPELPPQFMRIALPPLVESLPREVFDTTCPVPPRSPKPAWNMFVVNLPRDSHPREAISRKQLHFWNLPHPAVRWDILSWDPPVEGMNKRELSRDEIFHRKHVLKGGKLRVVLPYRLMPPFPARGSSSPQGASNTVSQHVLTTAAGVKIKLPPGISSTVQKVTTLPHPVSFERLRDSSVPSWRRSATPLTPLKRDRQNVTSVNGGSPDCQLNTTSRSPPPEPSTPLPQLTKPKGGLMSRPPSAQSATVLLPTVLSSDEKQSISKRPSRPDVAFFRTSRGDPEADSNKPLPRFTVTSELDSGDSADPSLANHHEALDASRDPARPVIGRSDREPPSETSLTRLIASRPESKCSDDLAHGPRPETPPSTNPNSTWGKSSLTFPLKESPARSAPDPEHLKAVWSQASGRPAGSTSNSLKGIADDLPSIPFTVQDMKSEDGETPPPTAPAPAPSRLSLQEVTRAFQQVPVAPAPSAPSRPPSYAQTPLLSPAQPHRSNQPVAISLSPQHGVRPAFAPYPHSIVGHSPSPTLMYAPGISSPVAHHRMAISGPSPPIAHGMWLPTPPPVPSQPGSYMRSAGAPPPTQMMYPSPGPGTTPGPPGQMMHRRMSVVNSGGLIPPAPSMYSGHPIDMQNHMHARSPHLTHTHSVGHAVPHMHVGHMFPPPQHGQAPAMYAVPVGAGRGSVMPRPGYEGYQAVQTHSTSYQAVPSTSFVFQS